MNNAIISAKRLLQMANEKRFFIYGNGYIAARFYRALLYRNAAANVCGFVVTAPRTGEKGPDGRNVLSVQNVPRNATVFMAVHESSVAAILNTLDGYGIIDCFWAAPCLTELELGPPLRIGETVSTRELFAEPTNYYNPAIYFLTAIRYINRETSPFDIYVKAQSIAADRKTAERRAAVFCRFIDRALKDGFDLSSALKLDETHSLIIDGNHRAALAKIFHVDTVTADIYHCTEENYQKLEGRWLVFDDTLKKYFSDKEVTDIKKYDSKLRNRNEF